MAPQEHDNAFWSDVVRKVGRFMYGRLHSHTYPNMDVDSVVGAALSRIIKKELHLRFQGKHFECVMYRTCTWVMKDAIDKYIRDRRFDHARLEEGKSSNEDSEDPLTIMDSHIASQGDEVNEHRHRLNLIHEFLEFHLKRKREETRKKDAEIYHASRFLGFKNREIAEQMKISINSVASVISTVEKELIEWLTLIGERS